VMIMFSAGTETVSFSDDNFSAANMTTSDDEAGAEGSSSAIVICFLFVGLLLGSLVNVIFSEFNITVPYSVLVFIMGMLLGVIEIFGGSEDLVFSMKVWTNIDPNLILFIFVPALLFGEVTNLNIHHVKHNFGGAALLAGPGAVLCTVLLGYYMVADWLPYSVHWTPNLAFLFASIMSATDPVAVVALLSKSHGSLQRMKYIITGEAILNDASALVMFNIFAPGIDVGGSPMNVKEAAVYLVKVLFISPVVGCLIGLGGVIATSATSRHYKEDHVIVQIAVPICCAYLSFYVGEEMLQISGIITCCAAGTSLLFTLLLTFITDSFIVVYCTV
jgi:sodium/hydrogen exchanger 10/11